jgi:hypothetical protein
MSEHMRVRNQYYRISVTCERAANINELF